MLDLSTIEQTIEELEDADTTFFNCSNLASLYIVRDHLKQTRLDKELFDIIPAYKRYCKVKKNYQLKEISEDVVNREMQNVCTELNEFIHALYCNTESDLERQLIKETIHQLYIGIK